MKRRRDAATVAGRTGTRRVLVVDIGGTHVKLLATGRRKPVRFDSGPKLTPAEAVRQILAATSTWGYDAVSIGYPGPVGADGPAKDPAHLGSGWTGFDFAAAFGKPVRLVNDAAMQALGGYRGGSMLFLGLGTGLGSALVIEGHLQPLELAHLPYHHGKSFEYFVSDAALKRRGHHEWRHAVIDVVNKIFAAMQADELLLGGGNARHLRKELRHLPRGTRLGGNADAFRGGFLLWHVPEERARRASRSWRR